MFGGAHWLNPLSDGLMIVGLALRWTAILTLGKAFSSNVAIQESQTIERSGLYRIVRHPSYLGMLIIFFSPPCIRATGLGSQWSWRPLRRFCFITFTRTKLRCAMLSGRSMPITADPRSA
jgi:protein-S-isoprenylcysteine O-methyltransferase Ste14